jgi:maltose-binding protein MalE
MGDYLVVAPLPASPAGPAATLLGVDGYYINLNSQNQVAMIDVILYLTDAKAEEEMMKDCTISNITTANDTDPFLKSLAEIVKKSYFRPQVSQLGLYWSIFCCTDQVLEKRVLQATWLMDATTAAKKKARPSKSKRLLEGRQRWTGFSCSPLPMEL